MLTTIVKGLSLISGLAAYAEVIPAKFLPIAALVFALASTLKDIVITIGDYMDDKQLNQSFKP